MSLYTRSQKAARLCLSLSLCGLFFACSAADPAGPAETPNSETTVNNEAENTSEGSANSEASTELSAEAQAALEADLEAQMKELGSPGLAVAIMKPGKVVWSKGFGMADLEAGKAVSPSTNFLIASISKTITYVHLLQAYEAGMYQLDDNISDYLPFAVSNPRHPDTAITFRMLMAHMASIRDEDSIDVYSRGKDFDYPLADFMKDYFQSGGKYYSAENNYFEYAPGEQFNYSNMGTALSGYLVEALKKKAFNLSSREDLLKPLGMTNSAWFLSELDLENLAIPYNEDNSPLQHYTFSDYPNGQMHSSANELGRFLAAVMNDGKIDDFQMLKAETMAEVRKEQYPGSGGEYGLGFHYEALGERRLFGHAGSEQGASTAMFYDPESNTGALVLMNKQDMDYSGLVEALLKAGESL